MFNNIGCGSPRDHGPYLLVILGLSGSGLLHSLGHSILFPDLVQDVGRVVGHLGSADLVQRRQTVLAVKLVGLVLLLLLSGLLLLLQVDLLDALDDEERLQLRQLLLLPLDVL